MNGEFMFRQRSTDAVVGLPGAVLGTRICPVTRLGVSNKLSDPSGMFKTLSFLEALHKRQALRKRYCCKRSKK
jgi:hypothetical protein